MVLMSHDQLGNAGERVADQNPASSTAAAQELIKLAG